MIEVNSSLFNAEKIGLPERESLSRMFKSKVRAEGSAPPTLCPRIVINFSFGWMTTEEELENAYRASTTAEISENMTRVGCFEMNNKAFSRKYNCPSFALRLHLTAACPS